MPEVPLWPFRCKLLKLRADPRIVWLHADTYHSHFLFPFLMSYFPYPRIRGSARTRDGGTGREPTLSVIGPLFHIRVAPSVRTLTSMPGSSM
jgi:hypothetical protein